MEAGYRVKKTPGKYPECTNRNKSALYSPQINQPPVTSDLVTTTSSGGNGTVSSPQSTLGPQEPQSTQGSQSTQGTTSLSTFKTQTASSNSSSTEASTSSKSSAEHVVDEVFGLQRSLIPTESSPKTYKLVLDNIDKTIKPNDMRMDNQTKSLHYVHKYAVLDRINLTYL